MIQKKISIIFRHFGLKIIILTAVLFFGSSMTSNKHFESLQDKAEDRPENIILMIGDGMGLTQISAALYSSKRPLHMERFKHVGFHKTYAKEELITDSAAGATAFACGIKTYNGAIGMNIDTLPQKNIIEEAEAFGLSTGLIATAFIVHATPAAFFAHQPIRILNERIAADLLEIDIDLIIGGGKKYFDRRDSDDRDLSAELKDKGYHVTDYMNKDLQQVNFKTKSKIVHFTADRHPVPVSAGRNYLPFASKIGARYLKQLNKDKGFFLMIEGSQIDWAGHGNEGQLMIEEVLDFDRAVGEILDFAEADKNTLVIVTADHETGGMAINPGSKKGDLEIEFTTNGHTASLVPVFAYGPGAEEFKGIYENTAIYYKMKKLLGLDGSKLSSQLSSGRR